MVDVVFIETRQRHRFITHVYFNDADLSSPPSGMSATVFGEVAMLEAYVEEADIWK